MNSITKEQFIAYLNSLVSADGNAINELVKTRVKCNQELAEHPKAQVGLDNGYFYIGLLGILCGVFAEDNHNPEVVGEFFGDELTGFIEWKEG